MTPAERSMRSRIAAYAMLARNDPRAVNAKARAVYRDSFRQGHSCAACPEFVMPAGHSEAEVTRRAEALRKAHYARLSLRSSRARSRNKKAAPVGHVPGSAGPEIALDEQSPAA
jgi:hypothetical protein